MSIIQLIQCDGGCKTTLDLNEDLPEGWTVLARGRAHECPDCHEHRKAVQAWESDRVREEIRVGREVALEFSEAKSKAMAKWDAENPRPAKVEVSHE
jgi:hypothetical protein